MNTTSKMNITPPMKTSSKMMITPTMKTNSKIKTTLNTTRTTKHLGCFLCYLNYFLTTPHLGSNSTTNPKLKILLSFKSGYRILCDGRFHAWYIMHDGCMMYAWVDLGRSWRVWWMLTIQVYEKLWHCRCRSPGMMHHAWWMNDVWCIIHYEYLVLFA